MTSSSNCESAGALSAQGNCWSHRLACLLAILVFPLIWMGGLVTSYDAGMSVPDWPTTYDYWFYPLRDWIHAFVAVWDMFLEHGHRLLAQLVGIVTFSLAFVVWRTDRRRWMRWVVVAAVVGVLLQGTLGGIRVLLNERLLARVHGSTAPLFFTLTAVLATLTSPRWFASRPPHPHRAASHWQRLVLVLTVGIYLEIVLGTQLRRPSHEIGLAWIYAWVWTKVIVASLIAGGIAWLVLAGRKSLGEIPVLRRRMALLAALFLLQVTLAAATWVTHYGWPLWFTGAVGRTAFTVVEESRLQITVTTLHVAVGSLCLATASNLLLWMHRLLGPEPR